MADGCPDWGWAGVAKESITRGWLSCIGCCTGPIVPSAMGVVHRCGSIPQHDPVAGMEAVGSSTLLPYSGCPRCRVPRETQPVLAPIPVVVDRGCCRGAFKRWWSRGISEILFVEEDGSRPHPSPTISCFSVVQGMFFQRGLMLLRAANRPWSSLGVGYCECPVLPIDWQAGLGLNGGLSK